MWDTVGLRMGHSGTCVRLRAACVRTPYLLSQWGFKGLRRWESFPSASPYIRDAGQSRGQLRRAPARTSGGGVGAALGSRDMVGGGSPTPPPEIAKTLASCHLRMPKSRLGLQLNRYNTFVTHTRSRRRKARTRSAYTQGVLESPRALENVCPCDPNTPSAISTDFIELHISF